MKIEIISKKEIKIIGMFQTVKIIEKKNCLYAQINMIRPNFNDKKTRNKEVGGKK